MDSANALIRLPDGQRVLCYPGDLVGRMESCRVRIRDPRVSEVHALFSLRHQDLYLLFLRKKGRTGDHELTWNLRLAPGVRVQLAEGLSLEVLSVQLPTEQLALSLDGGEPVAVGNQKYAIRPEQDPFLVPDDDPAVWRAGDGHELRSDEGVVAIEPGGSWLVGGRRITASLVGTVWTQTTDRSAEDALPRTEISLVRGDVLRAWVSDDLGRSGELRNNSAVVLHSLAGAGGCADWLEVCGALWGRNGHSMRDNLRNNVLFRLDRQLRALGIRDDLVVRQAGQLRFAPKVDWVWTDAEDYAAARRG